MADPKRQRVKLRDVALNSTQASKNPDADGFHRYIIGKHIPTDGGRIVSSNPIGDAEFGSRIRTIVRAGDIVCTTRGPHLKVAVATFDALSAHTNFILRTRNPQVLAQGFLKAIARSDAFQDHLRKHFRGSTNLFVNWSDAAEYEIALPPIDEQRAILHALEAGVGCVEAADRLLAESKSLVQSALKDMFALEAFSTPLSQVCSAPITYGIVQAGPHVPDGIPYIRVSDMTGLRVLSPAGMLRTSRAIAARYHRSEVRIGDIVVALRGVGGLCKEVPSELDGANLTQGTARVRVAECHNPAFILWALRSQRGQREFRKVLRGWKGESLLEITLGDLREIPVPIPPRPVQDRVAAQISELDRAEAIADERRAQSQALLRQLVNAALAEGAQ